MKKASTTVVDRRWKHVSKRLPDGDRHVEVTDLVVIWADMDYEHLCHPFGGHPFFPPWLLRNRTRGFVFELKSI